MPGNKVAIRILSSSRATVDAIFSLFTQRLGLAVASPPQEFVASRHPFLFPSSNLYSAAVHLSHNGVLEIVEVPWASKLRELGRKPPVSRLFSVEILKEESSWEPGRALPSSFYTMRSLSEWVSEKYPVLMPNLSIKETAAKPFPEPKLLQPTLPQPEVFTKGVKEIVVNFDISDAQSAAKREELDRWGFPVNGCAGVWISREEAAEREKLAVAVRLLPSRVSSLILSVNSLREASEFFRYRGVSSEYIGVSGSHQGQVSLSPSCLQGLDIRVCERVDHSSFFCESTEVVMDGALDELNHRGGSQRPTHAHGKYPHNDSVKTGAATAGGTGASDCWVEFRTMLKHPKGFLKKTGPV